MRPRSNRNTKLLNADDPLSSSKSPIKKMPATSKSPSDSKLSRNNLQPVLGKTSTNQTALLNSSSEIKREKRWTDTNQFINTNTFTHEKSRSKGSRGSGSRRKFENLEKIETMVNESYSKLSCHGEEGGAAHNITNPEGADQSIDIGLWKNMIFYKSIAHVQQQRKKQEFAKDKLAVNHYANVPSKIRAYIRRPIDGQTTNRKSNSRSKSKDKVSPIQSSSKPNDQNKITAKSLLSKAANSTCSNDQSDKYKGSHSLHFNQGNANRKSMTRCKSAEMIGAATGRKPSTSVIINNFLQNHQQQQASLESVSRFESENVELPLPQVVPDQQLIIKRVDAEAQTDDPPDLSQLRKKDEQQEKEPIVDLEEVKEQEVDLTVNIFSQQKVSSQDELKNRKHLNNDNVNQESYLLDIISKCSPKMLGEISILSDEEIQNSKKDMEGVGNCFMELVNLIIYERRELFHGWEQLQKYCSHKYDAYQHFLILKSCADLQKFSVEKAYQLEQHFIACLNESEVLKWPKCIFIMYLLCKALIGYAYYIYGFQAPLRQNAAAKTTPRDKKPILEEIQEQEGSSFEEEENVNNRSDHQDEEENNDDQQP